MKFKEDDICIFEKKYKNKKLKHLNNLRNSKKDIIKRHVLYTFNSSKQYIW
jgi:hypothetical protein